MRSSTSSRLVSSVENGFRGWIFVVFGFIFFFGFLYAAVISKLLHPSEYAIISAIQNDRIRKVDNCLGLSCRKHYGPWLILFGYQILRYYCFLVPLTLPILLVAVYFHWLSMKVFKHA